MSQTTQEIESPDTAARAAQSLEEMGGDLLGEKLILNMGPSHPRRMACCG